MKEKTLPMKYHKIKSINTKKISHCCINSNLPWESSRSLSYWSESESGWLSILRTADLVSLGGAGVVETQPAWRPHLARDPTRQAHHNTLEHTCGIIQVTIILVWIWVGLTEYPTHCWLSESWRGRCGWFVLLQGFLLSLQVRRVYNGVRQVIDT